MKYFWTYLQERFPLQANGLLIASYFTANYMLANSSTLQGGAPLEISWRFPAGCLVLLFMFFHMRVIDEHKDFERDRVVHPHRVLSRGLITLKQLGRVGLLVVTVEIIFSYLFGTPALFMCMVILAFSWLIYKEFYVGEVLENHLLLNAFLHLIIMPMYSLYVFTVVADTFPWYATLPVLLYAWVSYGVGFAYELARKTRVPSDECPGLITYSSVMGVYPPAWGTLLALLFSGMISALVGVLMGFAWWYHAVVVALLVIVAFGVLRFRIRTTTATAASLQVYAGMFIFAFDILLAVELIHLHGLVLI
ncbi:MAG TPA: UbiA family prenyltransferase [Anaerolineales bacterium]|nr:UbiA family prenyltransferase [Anaerolineales bacterium]